MCLQGSLDSGVQGVLCPCCPRGQGPWGIDGLRFLDDSGGWGSSIIVILVAQGPSGPVVFGGREPLGRGGNGSLGVSGGCVPLVRGPPGPVAVLGVQWPLGL